MDKGKDKYQNKIYGSEIEITHKDYLICNPMWKKMTVFKADSWTTGFPPRKNKTNIKIFLYNTGKLLTLIKKTDKNWPQPFEHLPAVWETQF